MTTSVSTTSPATSPSPLDVNGLLNPATSQPRKITADLQGDQLQSSTVSSAGDQKIFANSTKTMGKQDFLQLLVTQMRYQDPLAPQDNQQFISQLAQFSALEGTNNINTSIDDLGKKIETMVSGQSASATTISNASATSLIGKPVRVNAENIVFDPSATAPIEINVHTDPGTTSVLSVLDEKENIVNALPIKTSGENKVKWAGMKMDGSMAPAGKYHLKVTTQDGLTDTGYTYFDSTVSGINYTKDGLRLEVQGQQIGMDQVLHVGEEPAAAAAPAATTSSAGTAQ